MARREVMDDLDALLAIFPADLRDLVPRAGQAEQLTEVVLDLGRPPLARFFTNCIELRSTPVTQAEIDAVVGRVGDFGPDNRAGIERTLHRISGIRNRRGRIVGLTCRVGRAVFGTIDIVQDVARSGESVLLLGRPGVGKTTLLREMARVLADELGRRVMVVDTSNEIAGDGDVPHPAIGSARRMQVPRGVQQAEVMIEAIENHNPEVVVIDEIGTETEAAAARTIAERGVQLVGTAHGNTLENLVKNPMLADLIGGIQTVTLGDEEARRRGTQKTVSERKSPPTFQVVVEIQERDVYVIHHKVDTAVDQMLRGLQLSPEVRVRLPDGSVQVQKPPVEADVAPVGQASVFATHLDAAGTADLVENKRKSWVYPYAVSKERLERALRHAHAPLQVTDHLDQADLILTLKSHYRKMPRRLREAEAKGLVVHVIRSNTTQQMESWAVSMAENAAAEALMEAEQAARQVMENAQPVPLRPRNAYLRRMQHELIAGYDLNSESAGDEPDRHVVVLPAGGDRVALRYRGPVRRRV